MFRAAAAAVILFLSSAAALAAPATPQLMGDRLRAGELQQLEADLSTALSAAPQDDQVRFALGATQFLRTIEGMAQSMYRHGLEAPQSVEQNLPFFRFPCPATLRPNRSTTRRCAISSSRPWPDLRKRRRRLRAWDRAT